MRPDLQRRRTTDLHTIEELAAFVAGCPAADIGGQAREAASLLLADLMAATAAGLTSPSCDGRREAPSI